MTARAAGRRLATAIDRLAWLFAVAAGGVLASVAAVTVVSIVGRTAFGVPVPGDFELVEIGCAVAVFAALPYCHLRRGNVAVELFLRRAQSPARRVVDAVNGATYAAIAAGLAWRMALGGAELRAWGETSMILGVPLWWGFVPIVASLGLLAAVAARRVLAP